MVFRLKNTQKRLKMFKNSKKHKLISLSSLAQIKEVFVIAMQIKSFKRYSINVFAFEKSYKVPRLE